MTRKIDRAMLKATGASVTLAGLDFASPVVHSANEKVVRYLGTATTMGSEIDKKLFEDTGIKVKYIPVTTDEVTKRVLTQPNSLTLWTRNISACQACPVRQHPGHGFKRIKEFDNISTTHTLGEIVGKKIGDQGTARKSVLPEGPVLKRILNRTDPLGDIDPDRV